MAIFIPGSRPSNKPSGAALPEKPPYHRAVSAKRSAIEWSDSRIRQDLYMPLSRGDLGRLKETQIEGLKTIVDKARGADKHMSPSQTREAIKGIENDRIKLGLDRQIAKRITEHLSGGVD